MAVGVRVRSVMKDQFRKFALLCAMWMGSSYAFFAGAVVIFIWGLTGPMFHFSDTWQLVINTGTSLVTFLMVFIIQSTQTRDTQAIQLKLDELLRAVKDARNEMIGVEEHSDEHLQAIKEDFQKLSAQAEKQVKSS